ncbi:ribosome-binding factor A [Candidatus Saccharibacteria bacterium]|nr:ribosome-binding factor A [Candidatus Saccharibacteria bacterium]
MNIKNQKIAAIIQASSSQFFAQREICGDSIITVTGVDVSDGSKHADVWVGLIKIDTDDFTKRIPALNGLLRHFLTQTSSFQYTPGVHIKIDTSSIDTQKVYSLLK